MSWPKKAKEPLQPSRIPMSFGIPFHIGLVPLGISEELDADFEPRGVNNGGRFRIAFRDKEVQNPQECGDQGAVTKQSTEVPIHGLCLLKAALSLVYTNYKETIPVGNKIEDLLSRISALEKRVDSDPSDAAEERSWDKMIFKLQDIGGQLRLLYGRPGQQRLPAHYQDDTDLFKLLFKLLEDVRETIFDYQMEQQTKMYDRECELINQDEAAVFKSVHYTQGAEFLHSDRRGCLKGTCGAILDKIELWTRDLSGPPIYWLNGLAGTGKTTIAQTIAQRTFANGQLGASFFCSRDFEDRSNLHLIFPTLAVQFARKYTEFRSLFLLLVQQVPGIAREPLCGQMHRLIVQPLKEIDISTVIIIDALDECTDEEPASAILSVLGRFASEIPKVKFLVTGRPEPRIREGFRLPLSAEAMGLFVSHEVKPSHVDSDLRLFFRHVLPGLVPRRRGFDDWPTNEQLDLLCEGVAGLFVNAAAAIKFIGKQNTYPRMRLNLLLRSPKSSVREGKSKFKEQATLDLLYTSILQEAFSNYDDPDNDYKIRSVFGAVILAANPLSPSTIAMLLNFDVDDVFALFSLAQPLLILRDDINCPVRPFHKSFPDFIMDPNRCTSNRFHVTPPVHHAQLLIGCLDLMNHTLDKNMCKLPHAVANSDINDLTVRIEQYISPALRYACRSWHTHFFHGHTKWSSTLEITYALHEFLETKFLFWLEVLSVLGAVRNAVDALQTVVGQLEESPTLHLAQDCFSFLTGYIKIIGASVPHIYHSGLVLTPETSAVRKLYEIYAQPFTKVVHGLPASWGSNGVAATCPHIIELAVWSPCSRFIAISFRDPMIVDVMDSVTLQKLQTLKFNKENHYSRRALSFSPDGRTLTCCSYWSGGSVPEAFVITWDLQTGGIVSAIERQAPNDYLSAKTYIAYSTDGRMVGVLHQDYITTVISIYDVFSGVHTHDVYRDAHKDGNDSSPRPSLHDQNWCEIWSHGGSLRFATVISTTIIVWEVEFTPGASWTKVATLTIPDSAALVGLHPQEPRANALFLPASSRLALLHYKAPGRVLVWDAQESKSLLRYTNTSFYAGMSFSSDGRFFTCSTTGSEVYLWKEDSTDYVLHRILTPGIRRITPLLSPDGESILIHGFGSTVLRLWHTKSFTTTPSNGIIRTPRRMENFVLEFLPDRSLAAVARQKDHAVTVLDLKSGVPQLIIYAGMEVYGLTAIGSTIAVISKEKFATWNLPEGNFLPGARVGIEDSTRIVNFSDARSGYVSAASISLDFRYVAVLTESYPGSGRLYIYNASTGSRLDDAIVRGSTLWFLPETNSIGWVADGKEGEMRKITARDTLDYTIPIGDIEGGKCGCPHGSSHGYQITNDGWIINPSGKRLLMLPPSWQSDTIRRKWNGRFLALLHGALPEPVILELEP